MNTINQRQEQRQRARNRINGNSLKTRYGWAHRWLNWSWGCRKCGGSSSHSGIYREEVLELLQEHDRIVHNDLE